MGEYNNSTIILTIQVYHVTKNMLQCEITIELWKNMPRALWFSGSVALHVGWIPHVPIIVTIELSTKKKDKFQSFNHNNNTQPHENVRT